MSDPPEPYGKQLSRRAKARRSPRLVGRARLGRHDVLCDEKGVRLPDHGAPQVVRPGRPRRREQLVQHHHVHGRTHERATPGRRGVGCARPVRITRIVPLGPPGDIHGIEERPPARAQVHAAVGLNAGERQVVRVHPQPLVRRDRRSVGVVPHPMPVDILHRRQVRGVVRHRLERRLEVLLPQGGHVVSQRDLVWLSLRELTRRARRGTRESVRDRQNESPHPSHVASPAMGDVAQPHRSPAVQAGAHGSGPRDAPDVS
jgi:hypothetical protein